MRGAVPFLERERHLCECESSRVRARLHAMPPPCAPVHRLSSPSVLCLPSCWVGSGSASLLVQLTRCDRPALGQAGEADKHYLPAQPP